jgi:predicted AAA+ superfamily ATPase
VAPRGREGRYLLSKSFVTINRSSERFVVQADAVHAAPLRPRFSPEKCLQRAASVSIGPFWLADVSPTVDNYSYQLQTLLVWIERQMAAFLRAEAAQRPALLLTGIRQAGKTSLLERTFPNHGYVSLDLPVAAEQAESSGSQFLADHPPPVIIDEVQYAPKLLRYLKVAIDRRRTQVGQYLLTGSQKLALMAGVSESLAGRIGVAELHTLSLGEIERSQRRPLDRRALLDAMVTGGFPELVAQTLDPQRYYASYVATFLERDVRQALQVKSLRDFERFLRLCAVRTGQLLSMNSFAADIGVSPNTIRSWLSVLAASNVVMLLEPYHRNLGKRVIKTPKLYLLDTGLACFLAGLPDARSLGQSGLLGGMFETLVLGQIVRHYANRGERASISFFRDYAGSEVDFVVERGNQVRLVECKWSETPPTHHRAFDELSLLLGEERDVARTIATPERVRRTVSGVEIVGCVDLAWLD